MTSDDIVKHIIDFETQNNKNDLVLGGGQQNQNKHSLPLTHTNTLQSNLNQQQLEIANFLQERNITTLCHFTDAQNLPNILKYGLLSREVLDKLKAFNQGKYTYKNNDKMRLDGKLNHISLSISTINNFLLKRFLGNGYIENCAIVEIDARVLYEEIDNPRIYCQTNAATKYASRGSEFKHLKSMFDDTIEYYTSYNCKRHKRDKQEDNQPTDAQAEILWAGWVKPRFIKQHYIKDKKEFFPVDNVNFNLGGTMAFKKRQEEDELISVKIIFKDGSFELLKVTLEEFEEMSADFYQPKYYYKNGKGYPFPDESEWECLIRGFVVLKEA